MNGPSELREFVEMPRLLPFGTLPENGLTDPYVGPPSYSSLNNTRHATNEL